MSTPQKIYNGGFNQPGILKIHNDLTKIFSWLLDEVHLYISFTRLSLSGQHACGWYRWTGFEALFLFLALNLNYKKKAKYKYLKN